MSSRQILRHFFCSLVLTFFVSLSLVVSYKSHTKGKRARIQGDIILGGLFSVHSKGEGNVTCGDIDTVRGMQFVEAMLYTVDEINQGSEILPGIKLGVEIFDTCGRSTRALEEALHFIALETSPKNESEVNCDDGSEAKVKYIPPPIIGIIGGTYSTVSLPVATLLGTLHIPQISHGSTSSVLSDKYMFEYIIRTVPPDDYQVKAMVDIVQEFNWTYISTVASQGYYGEPAIEKFKQEARARNICIATQALIPTNSVKASYIKIVRRLLQTKEARAVILFIRFEDITGLLEAATRLKVIKRFIWIASDSWGRQPHPVKKYEKVAEGALTLDVTGSRIPEFDDYFLNISPHNNKRNPWFTEYWELLHDCKWKGENLHARHHPHKAPKPLCTGYEQQLHYNQEVKIPFLYEAVYAMAHALHKMHRDLCPTTDKICDNMKPFDGKKFLKEYLMKTRFDDGYGRIVEFDEHGDSPGYYTIFNYAYNKEIDYYDYNVVGYWHNKSLKLNKEKIIWPGRTVEIPASNCSKPCKRHEIISKISGCCIRCVNCKDWEYLYDKYTCKDCGVGRWPTPNRRRCFNLEFHFISWLSIYALVPLLISCLGIMAILFILAIYIQYNDTPVVMASGRELSYMLLAGCAICYSMTFILLAKPTPLICALQRIGVGFGYVIIFSAILTKTNRILRIFHSAHRTAQRPLFISPRSQIVIASILISIQIISIVIWLILQPPEVKSLVQNDNRSEIIVRCKSEDLSVLLSLVYSMFLNIICTVFAVKTRNIPASFNESRLIGFLMYTTLIIWLGFIATYFGTLNTYEAKTMALCISISCSASVTLLCLFAPKLYIIIFQPKKNIRQMVTSVTGIKPD